jgi:hypothetical protein
VRQEPWFTQHAAKGLRAFLRWFPVHHACWSKVRVEPADVNDFQLTFPGFTVVDAEVVTSARKKRPRRVAPAAPRKRARKEEPVPDEPVAEPPPPLPEPVVRPTVIARLVGWSVETRQLVTLEVPQERTSLANGQCVMFYDDEAGTFVLQQVAGPAGLAVVRRQSLRLNDEPTLLFNQDRLMIDGQTWRVDIVHTT